MLKDIFNVSSELYLELTVQVKGFFIEVFI